MHIVNWVTRKTGNLPIINYRVTIISQPCVSVELMVECCITGYAHRTQIAILGDKSMYIVKQVLHNCNTCKWHEGMSCRVPPPPSCPLRIQEMPPFTSTAWCGFCWTIVLEASWRSSNKNMVYTLAVLPELSTWTLWVTCRQRQRGESRPID